MKKFVSWLVEFVDVAVLFLCLTLVFGIWYWGVNNDDFSEHKLAENSEFVSEKFSEYIEHVFDYAGAVKGLYEGSEKVTQDELSAFVKAMMNNGEGYNSLLRFVVIEKIANKDIDEFKNNFIKLYGNKDYKLPINEEFESQYVSSNAVNGAGKSVAPSGQNLRIFDDRKYILEKIDAGEKSFVAFFPQVRNIPEYQGRIVMLGLPIEKSGQLSGFVTVILSVDSLIEEIGSWQPADIAWSWTWNGEKISERNIENIKKRTVSNYSDIHLDSSQKVSFEFKTERVISEYWNWVLGLGVAMSFVVYVMVYSLSLSGQKTKEMAAEMTKDLAKYKLALDSNNSHVIITDVDGKVVYANDSVSRLTGYSREEILGQTPRLWGRQMPAEFYAKFWDAIKNKRQVFRGEVTNRRKDGTLYTAEAIVSPIVTSEGELVGFVGAELDITSRKKIEEDTKKHTEEVEKLNDLMVDRELKMIEMKKELEKLRGNIKDSK